MKITHFTLSDNKIQCLITDGQTADMQFDINRNDFENWLILEGGTGKYTMAEYYEANTEINNSAILAHLKEYITSATTIHLDYKSKLHITRISDLLDGYDKQSEVMTAVKEYTAHLFDKIQYEMI